ncbi:toll-like receptor 13 isoform X2 [Anabrus simplex]|uniref:toll-like receptor 13 isoform X2 n=1 Tax=Anabrus simplex TaxID=316456 RepID=UPI0035A3CADE
MKTSLYVKWHCHIQWNLILVVLNLTIKNGTGVNNIESQTKMLSFNGELRIPVTNVNTLREEMKCPDEISQLPLLSCYVLDTNYYNCPNSNEELKYETSHDETHVAVQLMRLDGGRLPLKNLTTTRIINLRADYGGLEDLDESTLQNFPELEKLSLTKHWFSNIYFIDHVFSEQRNLQELYLDNNGITSWNDSGMLVPVSGSLRHLDLSRSGMSRQLLQNVIEGLKSTKNNSKLEGLSLAQMGHTEIPGGLFYYVASSLKYLSLYGNHFTFKTQKPDGADISTERDFPTTFPHLPKLEELDLRANSMNFLPPDILQPLPNLTKLLLGSNEFLNLDNNLFRPVKKLTFLSLTNNRNTKLQMSDGIFSDLKVLEYLDLSFSALSVPTMNTFKGLHSLQKLSLYSTKLERITEQCFSELKNLQVLDISGNKLSNSIHPTAFVGLTELQELYARGCGLSLRDVRLDDLHNITVFDLTANNVEQLDMFVNKNLSKLNTLILTGNKIVNWQEQLFSESSVRKLLLAKNLMNEITAAMLKDFNIMNIIDASENPYQCYCTMQDISLSNLTNWPKLYTCQAKNSTLIQLQNISAENCVPKSTSYKSNGNDNEDNLEDSANTAIVISAVCGMVIFTALTAFCYWKWWHIRICTRMLHNSGWFSIMSNEDEAESNNTEKYFYDVFVSYSDPDRRWIMDHLLPNLEANYQVKVCLHERDFKAGLSILENIMACMEQSRCILLVLSKAFLKSHWCQFELNMAQHFLLEMKRDQLLLVLLEPVPREHCSKMMRYLMLSKTYLQWPSNDKDNYKVEEQLFWRRLHKAVGCPQDIAISLA